MKAIVKTIWPSLALFALAAIYAQAALAGPYAQLAAEVKSAGGVLQVVAMGGVETQASAQLDVMAIGLCRTIAKEGVTVTSIQIVGVTGKMIRLVGSQTLSGC